MLSDQEKKGHLCNSQLLFLLLELILLYSCLLLCRSKLARHLLWSSYFSYFLAFQLILLFPQLAFIHFKLKYYSLTSCSAPSLALSSSPFLSSSCCCSWRRGKRSMRSRRKAGDRSHLQERLLPPQLFLCHCEFSCETINLTNISIGLVFLVGNIPENGEIQFHTNSPASLSVILWVQIKPQFAAGVGFN